MSRPTTLRRVRLLAMSRMEGECRTTARSGRIGLSSTRLEPETAASTPDTRPPRLREGPQVPIHDRWAGEQPDESAEGHERPEGYGGLARRGPPRPPHGRRAYGWARDRGPAETPSA